MACWKIITLAGLVLGMVGSGLILKYGLPPKIDPDGHQYIILEQEDENEKKKAKDYDRKSDMGLGLLIASFFLQAIGVIAAP